MLQDPVAGVNHYMNSFGCNVLGYSSEELLEMGDEYFERFFPAEGLGTLRAGLREFSSPGDLTAVHSFFNFLFGK